MAHLCKLYLLVIILVAQSFISYTEEVFEEAVVQKVDSTTSDDASSMGEPNASTQSTNFYIDMQELSDMHIDYLSAQLSECREFIRKERIIHQEITDNLISRIISNENIIEDQNARFENLLDDNIALKDNCEQLLVRIENATAKDNTNKYILHTYIHSYQASPFIKLY